MSSPGKYAAIRQLGCYEDVEARLKSGESVPEVARYIQDECGEYTNVTRESLVTILYGFRSQMKDVGLVGEVMPTYVRDAQKRIEAGLNEMDVLEEMILFQWERCKDFRELERKLNFPNAKIDNSMRVLAEIIARRHNVKMDLGFNGGRDLGTMRVSQEITDSVAHRYGDGARRAIMDPESRARVLALFNRLEHVASRVADTEADSGDR